LVFFGRSASPTGRASSLKKLLDQKLEGSNMLTMKRYISPFALAAAVVAEPQAAAADLSFLSPVTDFFSDLFASYGNLGPALVPYNVTVRNTKFIYSTINRGAAADTLVWPSEEIKKQAGVDAWGDWRPKPGMSASVLYGWGTGQKWLLHVVQDDKYMVVRDPVISNSWKQGKKFWFDHHVNKRDPRHIDRVEQQKETERKDAETKKSKPASDGKCNGITTGKGELPPTWVMVVMGIILISILGLGVKKFLVDTMSPNHQQAAGESSAEQRKCPSANKKEAKKE